MSLLIDSKPFGQIEIDDRQIIVFPGGLFGFEKYSRFALIEESPNSVFKWLQCLEDKNLAFIVIQPELFTSTYVPIIPPSELKSLKLTKIEDALIMVIVSIPGEDPDLMTANLQGPILINKKDLVGGQFISRDETHPVRKLILDNKKTPERV
jgi:flagellar assembly factor FliW